MTDAKIALGGWTNRRARYMYTVKQPDPHQGENMTSLDDELTAAAPPVPLITPELDRELVFLVAEAERLARPAVLRTRVRLALGSLVVVGAVGAGTVAAGAAGVLPWFDTAPSSSVVTTSTGSECSVTFGVKGIEDPQRPVDAATRAEALTVAEDFLAGFDVSSIEDPETSASMYVVQARVDAELERQGLPTAAVSVSMATSCDGSDR